MLLRTRSVPSKYLCAVYLAKSPVEVQTTLGHRLFERHQLGGQRSHRAFDLLLRLLFGSRCAMGRAAGLVTATSIARPFPLTLTSPGLECLPFTARHRRICCGELWQCMIHMYA